MMTMPVMPRAGDWTVDDLLDLPDDGLQYELADVLAVRREDVGELNITAPLLLAVEVLSPSTWAKDLILKRGLYEDSGIPSYWVVDPDEPSLLVLEPENDRYVEKARVTGTETVDVTTPFAVSVTPALLLD